MLLVWEAHLTACPLNNNGNGEVLGNEGMTMVNDDTTMVNDDHDQSRASGHELPLEAPISPSKKQMSTPIVTKESLAAMSTRLRS